MTEELNVMTPQHSRWEEFYQRLQGPEGCNFQKDPEKGYTWLCGGGNDQSKSRAILETIDGLDVDLSLRVFSACGGHCDCEVLFNVKDVYPRWFPESPTETDILVGLSDHDEWVEEILSEEAEKQKLPLGWPGMLSEFRTSYNDLSERLNLPMLTGQENLALGAFMAWLDRYFPCPEPKDANQDRTCWLNSEAGK